MFRNHQRRVCLDFFFKLEFFLPCPSSLSSFLSDEYDQSTMNLTPYGALMIRQEKNSGFLGMYTIILPILTIFYEPSALASLQIVLGMWASYQIPDILNQSFTLGRVSKWFLCTWWLDKHCSRSGVGCPGRQAKSSQLSDSVIVIRFFIIVHYLKTRFIF